MSNQCLDPQDEDNFKKSCLIVNLEKNIDVLWVMLHESDSKKEELEKNQEKIIQFYEESEFALKEKLVELARLTDILFNALCVARAYMPANYHSTVNEIEGRDVVTVNYAINAYEAGKGYGN